ncbi:precorrin-6y C5,15-methyltransferase (decarboxylating) subunit CbiE [Allokutzneria albata]|uniref:Precorrin-6Y C5,15-methyltransferase (Decarboxylating) n=1 Tax=Allokutzneria albata TaxID=211114 RepID=A0A1G9X9U9_ALLAB|nr:precorrin-6y C5,15-methyltransferase (decarboxylating) subunit CbiE [Allokutzneria albata]SDM93103.1 precorrin-6Y C5,15-methyltransferase (decarboxylating) [Allokutzneria albata]
MRTGVGRSGGMFRRGRQTTEAGPVGHELLQQRSPNGERQRSGPPATVAVSVLGVDGDGLPRGATELLAGAKVVLGSRAHLDAHAPEGARRVELAQPGTEQFDQALTDLGELSAEDGPAVIITSGDPGFFGVMLSLRERGVRAGKVLPGVSGVQRLMAKLGRSWDDVLVVSARGRDLRRALNVCRARPAVAVLTDAVAGPAEIGAGLTGWRRTLIVAEDLDTPDERISVVDPPKAAKRRWRDPNVVLCLADPEAVPPRGWCAGGDPTPPAGGWGLPEESFAHRDGTVSKAEVRALALAKLAPRPGSLIWDVGSGAGALAIECARLGAAVIAIEPNPVQCMRIIANAATHGVDMRIVENEAPAALVGLPRPDSIFVGGGGPEVVAACAAVGAERVVVALTALDRLGASRDALRHSGYVVDGCQLSANRLATMSDGASRFVGTTPTLILWGRRKPS